MRAASRATTARAHIAPDLPDTTHILREHERYDRAQNSRSRPPRRIAPAPRPIVANAEAKCVLNQIEFFDLEDAPLPLGARTSSARRAPDGAACAPTPASDQ